MILHTCIVIAIDMPCMLLIGSSVKIGEIECLRILYIQLNEPKNFVHNVVPDSLRAWKT
jgi:hypothetical protein